MCTFFRSRFAPRQQVPKASLRGTVGAVPTNGTGAIRGCFALDGRTVSPGRRALITLRMRPHSDWSADNPQRALTATQSVRYRH